MIYTTKDHRLCTHLFFDVSERLLTYVMPGLDPGIHVYQHVNHSCMRYHVDGRVKPGHDDNILIFQRKICAYPGAFAGMTMKKASNLVFMDN